MGKEYGSLLDLKPVDEKEYLGSRELSLVLPENEQMRKEIVQISDDNIVFQANVDAFSSRSCTSIKKAGKIFQYASEINKEVSSTLTTMVEETRGSTCGPYVEEFNNHLARMASQNTMELVRIGAGKIAQELTKPPLPPLVYSKPQGFFAKLLG